MIPDNGIRNIDAFLVDLDSNVEEVSIENDENSDKICCKMDTELDSTSSVTGTIDNDDKDGATIPFQNDDYCDIESLCSDATVPMTFADCESVFKIPNPRFNDLSNISLKNRKRKRSKVLSDTCVDGETKVVDNCNVVVDSSFDYQIGSMLWGKVGKYPWWPCMIFPSPQNEYIRTSSVHVVYFGQSVERGWVKKNSMIPYLGVERFQKFIEDKLCNGGSNKGVTPFSVPHLFQKRWTVACEEAENALPMSTAERLDKYGVDFYDNRKSESETSSKCSKEPKRKPSAKRVSIGKAKLASEYSFEFEALHPPQFVGVKPDLICQLCCKTGHSVMACRGYCGNTFHRKCIQILLNFLTEGDEQQQFSIPPIDYNKCVDCNRNICRCFSCHKLIEEASSTIRCTNPQCHRTYHASCLMNGPKRELSNKSKIGILCPAHTCHTCFADDPKCVRHSKTLIRCVMCPSAFHRGDWCIPAGSIELSSLFIICPQHLEGGGNYDRYHAPFMNVIKDGCITLPKLGFCKTPYGDPDNTDLWKLTIKQSPKKIQNKSNNVSWCFICSKDGLLLCCEKCPAAVHETCAEVDGPLPDQYICEQCALGRYPRYGEVHWVKCGSFRWWPGQIVHPRHASERLLRASHKPGHFLVQYFGTNDHSWANRTQTYSFEDKDDQMPALSRRLECENNSSSTDESTDTVDKSLPFADACQLAVQIAGEAQRSYEIEKGHNFNDGHRPPPYRHIRVNIVLPQHNGGAHRNNRPISELSDVPHCDCRPGIDRNDDDPCGSTSGCINRELYYECNPDVCRNGPKCRNQMFSLRQYPQLIVFYTGDRGFGIQAGEPITKGTFVIEYVGELINDKEADRRMNLAHQNEITDFYMMQLDNERIIDAGPAGNLSRFMNHSCSPNLITQKWTVENDTRIGLFALKDIAQNEELTFNYLFTSLGNMKITCKCGAPNCSSFIGIQPLKADSHFTNSMAYTKVNEIKKKSNSKKKSKKRPLELSIESQIESEPLSVPSKKRKVEITPASTDDSISMKCCPLCGEGECDLPCLLSRCPYAYHRRCLQVPKEVVCPRHFCDQCGALSRSFCSFCPSSFCLDHQQAGLIKSVDTTVCYKHTMMSSKPIISRKSISNSTSTSSLVEVVEIME